MADSECECQSIAKTPSTDRRIPTLDNDLRVRRFQRGDTRRIHNLFLEETRCLVWPMFAQTVRSPPAIFFHLLFMVVGVTLARSCIFALFGVILVFCVVFLYIYRWFYQFLTSSLRGDLANISQVSVSLCNNTCKQILASASFSKANSSRTYHDTLAGRYYIVNRPKTTESQQSVTWKPAQSN